MINLLFAVCLVRLPLSFSRYFIRKLEYKTQDRSHSSKQILIDISEVIKHDARSGIQRVVRGILPLLIDNPPPGYIIKPVFAERRKGYRYASVSSFCLQADEKSRHHALPVVVQKGDIFLGLDLAAHLIPRHQRELLCWKRNGVRISMLVYDLLPLQHPQWFNPKRNKTFIRWMRTLALYSDDLICISKTVQNELQQLLSTSYGLRKGAIRLGLIRLGADISCTLPSKECSAEELLLLNQLQSKLFVLMVGTLEPRKGYTYALDAFEKLWQKGVDISLVIVGKPGWQTKALQHRLRSHSEKSHKLFWFDDASDKLLHELYKASSGLLITSEAEGFGLPLIEALFHGKVVLARDIPIFREVGENAITYFTSDKPEMLAVSIKEWHQQSQSKQFNSLFMSLSTWSSTSKQLLFECGIEVPNFF
jgi:glycosyltransferase involved in cell wall biosynthesis